MGLFELIGDRKQAYKFLADSNLDWRGSGKFLERYMKNYPGSIFEPQAPTAGRIIVSVNNLVGVVCDPEKYRWLRENFQPVGNIAYAYLIYDIPADQLEKIGRGADTAHNKKPR